MRRWIILGACSLLVGLASPAAALPIDDPAIDTASGVLATLRPPITLVVPVTVDPPVTAWVPVEDPPLTLELAADPPAPLTATPEPATLLLVGTALVAVGWAWTRRQRP